MRMIVCLLILCLTSGVCTISCDSESPLEPGWSLGAAAFPRAVGMLWTYQVYDSLTSTVDTVQVSIIDTVTLGRGDLVTVWKSMYAASKMEIEHYVAVRGDTLIILSDTLHLSDPEHFAFPLKYLQSWTGPASQGDTSRVTAAGNVSVPAGDFANGARVERSWNGDFEGGGHFTTTWLVPDVGIVFRHFLRCFSDGGEITVTDNEVWELLDYDLSTFKIDRFPREIGSRWVYETWDGALLTYDTLVVSIVDTFTQAGHQGTVWEYEFGVGVGTGYMLVLGDRIEWIQDTAVISFYDFYMDFPLAVGRSADSFATAPVVGTIAKGPVTVSAGTFSDGFNHYAHRYSFNAFWSLDDWWVPDVGLVSRVRREYNLGPVFTVTWELLEYRIEAP